LFFGVPEVSFMAAPSSSSGSWLDQFKWPLEPSFAFLNSAALVFFVGVIYTKLVVGDPEYNDVRGLRIALSSMVVLGILLSWGHPQYNIGWPRFRRWAHIFAVVWLLVAVFALIFNIPIWVGLPMSYFAYLMHGESMFAQPVSSIFWDTYWRLSALFLVLIGLPYAYQAWFRTPEPSANRDPRNIRARLEKR
jgi:hypothetical protein